MKQLTVFALTLFVYACGAENTESSNEITTNESVVENKVDFIEEEIASNPEDVVAEETVDNESTFKAFEVGLHLADPDEKSKITNVRNSPSGDVILELNNQDDCMFDVVGMQNGWFKIKNLSNADEDLDLGQKFGWIHWSVVGASTRNYDGSTIELHEEPSSKSPVSGKLKQESFIRITDGSEGWVKVKYDFNGEKAEDWMKIDMICGNPYTTCS